MPNIKHITAQELLIDSFKLGKKIYESGFRPRHAISLWRGGTPVGLGIDAYFRMNGIFINHTTVATSSYTGINEREKYVTVKGLEHIIDIITPEDKLLIIDDVYESGNTIKTIIETLKEKTRANFPKDILVATIHNKPECHKYTDCKILSLYNIAKDIWIDYPHELSDLIDEDLSFEKIKSKNPEIYDILKKDKFEIENVSVNEEYKYVSPEQILVDSIKLGINIYNDKEFFPDFIIAVWQGGVLTGLPIHEVFKFKMRQDGNFSRGPDHISINTTSSHLSYKNFVVGIKYLEDKINKNDKILLIDTAFKRSNIINDVINILKQRLRRNLNHKNIKVASIYYNEDDTSTWTTKPTVQKPDYYLKKIDSTIIYPHSIHKLHSPKEELKELNKELYNVLYE